MSTYVFDPAWQKERDRLGALETLFDRSSRRYLADLGVGEGWRCLEVGCGAGGLARWMADQVGTTGQVIATDLDTRFLDGHGRANLEVLVHDIVTDPLEDAAFDLVHARTVLTHLPARQRVLARMAAAVKPGGWLFIEDIDFGGAMPGGLAGYVSAPEPSPAAAERVYQAVAAVFAAAGADPSYGTRLPAALAGVGLVEVGAEVHTPILAGGTEDWVSGSVEQLSERLVGSGVANAADIELFLAVTRNPSTYYVPPLMISAWGRRPERN
jgi:2-polyprenyl-3-methyl-5-hydroxy-6-metoxy-1,4-benzoquinol methylase